MSNAKGKRGKPDVREVLEVQCGLPMEGEAEAEGRTVPQVPQPAAPDGALPEVGALAGPEAGHSVPFDLDRAIDDLVGAICDPIIVWPGGWGETLPEWIRPEITMERMVQLIKKEEGLATDAEAMAYMYTVVMTMPVNESWTEIYLYLATKVMKKRIKGEVPEDIRRETLTDYQQRQLRDLKAWIWHQRVKARKERRRQERREEKEREVETAPQKYEQLGLPL